MVSYRASDERPFRDLGARLQALRLAHGLSLRAAAKVIGGISYNRLRDFERGEDPHSGIPTRPGEAHLERIAKAYKADLNELLRLAGYPVVSASGEWEEHMLLRLRALSPGQRDRMLELLTDVEGGYEG